MHSITSHHLTTRASVQMTLPTINQTRSYRQSLQSSSIHSRLSEHLDDCSSRLASGENSSASSACRVIALHLLLYDIAFPLQIIYINKLSEVVVEHSNPLKMSLTYAALFPKSINFLRMFGRNCDAGNIAWEFNSTRHVRTAVYGWRVAVRLWSEWGEFSMFYRWWRCSSTMASKTSDAAGWSEIVVWVPILVSCLEHDRRLPTRRLHDQLQVMICEWIFPTFRLTLMKWKWNGDSSAASSRWCFWRKLFAAR